VLITFCLFGYGTAIQAQNSIPAAGGNGTGAGGTVSYTIGQVVYTTITGTTKSISAGVQQPFEISVITGISDASAISLEVSVYPNPSSSYVILKVEKYDTDDLTYILYDMNVILFQDKKFECNEPHIQLGNIITGTYLLKVADNNKEIKTFKIIKK